MSTLKFNTWLNTDNTENYKCRAWVNFNGTGTVAIRASGNVSSITDVTTGRYEVNFINAMPDANYSRVFAGNQITLVDSTEISTSAKTAVRFIDLVGTPQDVPYVSCAIFR